MYGILWRLHRLWRDISLKNINDFLVNFVFYQNPNNFTIAKYKFVQIFEKYNFECAKLAPLNSNPCIENNPLNTFN